MTDRESWGPDEWIDPWAPVDRLHQMPLLAAQAVELGQTRNPSGDRRAQRSHTSGSRPPARLDLIDVADDTTEARGELRALILWCSRPIWEGVDHDTRAAHQQPLGTPTWETECAWLAGIWQTSRAQLDEVELDMTYRQLDRAYSALCRAVGLRPPQRWPCLTEGCQGNLEISDDGWLRCESGHTHPGIARWKFHKPMALPDLANEFDVKEGTLCQWHARGKLPYSNDSKPFKAWPWDVIRCKHPDDVELIDDEKAS